MSLFYVLLYLQLDNYIIIIVIVVVIVILIVTRLGYFNVTTIVLN